MLSNLHEDCIFYVFAGESKCGNPGSPSHGNMTVHKDSYFIGESVAFSCDSGYVLNDSSLESMTCENDTTWSGNIPVCERKY